MYNKITLLGNAQDAGRPQLGCNEKCCVDARKNKQLSRMPVSLGLDGDEVGIVEATRCIEAQLSSINNPQISEIWLTHAHLGHIEGLGQFGRESLNSKGVKLRCSDSVAKYVTSHPIWQKLFDRGNLILDTFYSNNVIPIKVPHRAQDFETHSFLFKGNKKNLLFLPDHDNWEQTLDLVGHKSPKEWFSSIDADIILLDGTFWNLDELDGRVQKEVPHPPVVNTLDIIGKRKSGDPRIIFIHLNHTNPLHYSDSKEYRKVQAMGWEIGQEGMEFSL